jgi:hypothetical protein
MELHISITDDEASGKKMLDILNGGSVMEQLERPVRKKHAGRPKKHIEKDIDMNEVSEKIFGK